MTRAVGALIRKDLLLERRVPQLVPAMALFSVTTFVVFRFALQEEAIEGTLAAGVLAVTLLLSAVIGANRVWVADQDGGGLDAFLLAPVDRTALFVAKVIVLLGFLVLVQLIAVPAFVVLLLEPGLGVRQVGEVVAVLALADVGIAVIGTLVSALAVQTRARDLIGPLIALPLLVPVVIGVAKGLAPVLAEGGAEALPGRWLLGIALYAAVFGFLAYAVFDFLVED